MSEPLSYTITGFLPWSLTWLLPYLGALVLSLAYIAGFKGERLYGLVSVASILLSALISTLAAYRVFTDNAIYAKASVAWFPWLGVTFGTYIDGLGAVMALVVSWLSFLIAVYSLKYMEGDWGFPRYFIIFTFFVASMQLVVLADNLILLFIGWEGTGLASYALIGHWYTDEEDKWVGVPGRRALGKPMYFEPSHSAVRAVLFTRVGDVGLVIGIAAIYLASGTLVIPELASTAAGWLAELASKGILPAILLVFTLGALAKSAQFPFHEWLVTAMTGPTPVSALIHAATMVKAGVYFMLRFAPILIAGAMALGTQAVVEGLRDYFLIVAGLGAITAFALATMALVSNELKLILAYSTASQLGYMFIAAASAGLLLGFAGVEEVASSVMAGLSHLVSHAVFKAALFLVAGWLIHVAHSRFIDRMGGYARYMKLTAVSLWLAGLSLAGIPPLSGFFSKELVIHYAEEAGVSWIFFLAVVTAGLTAAYTIRMILRVMHLEPLEADSHVKAHEAPKLMLIPYLVLAIASLALGVGWSYTSGLLSKASELTIGLVEKAKLSVELTGVTGIVMALVLGSIGSVYYLYSIARVDFRDLIERNTLARYLHDFLFDRWYINSIYYIVIVGSFSYAAYAMYVLDGIIDAIYHAGVPMLGALGAMALRVLHRGRTDYYLAMYAYFISLALLLLYLFWGR
ncbi:MAG: NADH-quinone oxidoreductase subunit L [Desulfurococcales archaeon]|nr:NADH-quinone oxidoreductase subunit L [Desulfurococcales archaeon]